MRFKNIYNDYYECYEKRLIENGKDKYYDHFMKNNNGEIILNDVFIKTIKIDLEEQYKNNFTNLLIYFRNNILDKLPLHILMENMIINLEKYCPGGLFLKNGMKLVIEHNYNNNFDLYIKKKFIKKSVRTNFKCQHLSVPKKIVELGIKLFPCETNKIVYKLNKPIWFDCVYNFDKEIRHIIFFDDNYNQLFVVKNEEEKIDIDLWQNSDKIIKFIEVDYKKNIDDNYFDINLYLSCVEYFKFDEHNVSKIVPNSPQELFSSINYLNNTLCPIAQQEIENGSNVGQCRRCSTNYNLRSLYNWFELGDTRCPICRISTEYNFFQYNL